MARICPGTNIKHHPPVASVVPCRDAGSSSEGLCRWSRGVNHTGARSQASWNQSVSSRGSYPLVAVRCDSTKTNVSRQQVSRTAVSSALESTTEAFARINDDEGKDERIGVLLLNLGGPESLDDVQPFLYNLFADPVSLPLHLL